MDAGDASRRFGKSATRDSFFFHSGGRSNQRKRGRRVDKIQDENDDRDDHDDKKEKGKKIDKLNVTDNERQRQNGEMSGFHCCYDVI
jgi:hypothetical protein